MRLPSEVDATSRSPDMRNALVAVGTLCQAGRMGLATRASRLTQEHCADCCGTTDAMCRAHWAVVNDNSAAHTSVGFLISRPQRGDTGGKRLRCLRNCRQLGGDRCLWVEHCS